MPWYKKTLLALAAFILLAAAGLAAVLLFVDPSRFRPVMARQIQSRTGLLAEFAGEVKWRFRPSLGLEFNQVTLRNPANGTVLLKVDSAGADFKLRPLLTKRLEINRLHLSRPMINLETDSTGRLRLPERPGGPSAPGGSPSAQPKTEAAKPLNLDIDRLDITEAEITHQSPAGRTSGQLASLSLRKARLTKNPGPTGLGVRLEHLGLNALELKGPAENGAAELGVAGLMVDKLDFTQPAGQPFTLILGDLALKQARAGFKDQPGRQPGFIGLDQASLKNLELIGGPAGADARLRLARLELAGLNGQNWDQAGSGRLALADLRLDDFGFGPAESLLPGRRNLKAGALMVKELQTHGPAAFYKGQGRLGQLGLTGLNVQLEGSEISQAAFDSLNLSQAASLGPAGAFDGQIGLDSLALTALVFKPSSGLEERLNFGDLALTGLNMKGKVNREALNLNLASLELGPVIKGGARKVKLQGAYDRLALSGGLTLSLALNPERLTLDQLALAVKPPDFPGTIDLTGQAVYHLKNGFLDLNKFQAQSAGLQLAATGQAGTKPFSWRGAIRVNGPLAPVLKALGVIKASRPKLAADLTVNGSWPIRAPEGLSLNGSLDGSQLRADLKPAGKTGFQGNLTVDRLNLHEYQALMSSGETSAPKTTRTGPETIDPNLKIKNSAGDFGPVNIKIDRLTLLPGLDLTNFQATVNAKENQVAIAPLAFNVFDGSYNGQAGLNLAQAPPAVTAKGQTVNLNLQSSQNWLLGLAPLSGQGQFDFDLSFRAAPTLLSTLNGRAKFKAVNSQLRTLLKPLPLVWPGAAKYNEELNTINTITGSFDIKNGLAATSDLKASGPRFEAQGQGTINLPQSSLNLEVVLDAKIKNLTPVAATLYGPFNDLKWKIDASELLKKAAESSGRPPEIPGLNQEKGSKPLEILGDKLEKRLSDRLKRPPKN